jgi:hypothetical protein
MVYSFRWFQAQIKAGDKGFSPRGITGGGGHQMVAHGSRTSDPVLGDGERELQGAKSAGSLSNGCGTVPACS